MSPSFNSVRGGHLEITYDAYNYTAEEFLYIYVMFTDRKVRIGPLCLEYRAQDRGLGFVINVWPTPVNDPFIYLLGSKKLLRKTGKPIHSIAKAHSLRFIVFVLVVKFALAVISLVGIHFSDRRLNNIGYQDRKILLAPETNQIAGLAHLRSK